MEALFRAAIHHDVADDVAAVDSGNRRRGGRREPLDTASGPRRIFAAGRAACALARAARCKTAVARRRPRPAENLRKDSISRNIRLPASADAARPRHHDTRLHRRHGYVRRAHRLALSSFCRRLRRRRNFSAAYMAGALPHEARLRLPRPVGRPAQQGISGYSGAYSFCERRRVGRWARTRISEAELSPGRLYGFYIRGDRRGARLRRHGLRACALRLLDASGARDIFPHARRFQGLAHVGHISDDFAAACHKRRGSHEDDTFDWNGKFPDDYGNADYAGKDVTFTITVKGISVEKVPELTDDFVKSVSEESKTVDEYKKEMKKQLEEENQTTYEDTLRQEVWETVLGNTEVKKYPKDEVKEMSDSLTEQYQSAADYYGTELEDFIETQMGMTMEDFESQVDQAVKSSIMQSMVTEAIADKEKIEPTKEEYNEQYKEIAEITGYHPKYILKLKKEMLDGIASSTHGNKHRKPKNAISEEEEQKIISLYKKSHVSIRKFCKFYGRRSYSCVYQVLKRNGLIKE